MTINRFFFILWLSLSLLSLHLISSEREGDYSSLEGSKLVKLLKSQNREIRGLAFCELQRRQCPEVYKSYAEFKKNYKVFEVLVSPIGADTSPVYLVLYDYDYLASSADQYYGIPDREIFVKPRGTGIILTFTQGNIRRNVDR